MNFEDLMLDCVDLLFQVNMKCGLVAFLKWDKKSRLAPQLRGQP